MDNSDRFKVKQLQNGNKRKKTQKSETADSAKGFLSPLELIGEECQLHWIFSFH